MLRVQELSPQVVATDCLSDLAQVLDRVPSEALGDAIDLLLQARELRRRVYILGNGGSAATASHFVCDLMKTAQVDGLRPIRAFALTDNTPLFSAWSNDSAYEHAFAEQVAALVDPGDIVIGISASGNSPNVVAGLRAAVRAGARTIGLLGFDGGAAHHLVEVSVHVPSHDYALVEATHLAICHAITTAIRKSLLAA